MEGFMRATGMLNNYDYEAIHGEDSNIALLFWTNSFFQCMVCHLSRLMDHNKQF